MKLIIWDFSRTLLFPIDQLYTGSLNDLYKSSTESIFDIFFLNTDLIEYIKDNLNNNQNIIFTTGTVQNDIELLNILNKVFAGIENVESIGYKKADSNAYTKLCQLYKVSPQETLFIDDDMDNITAADTAGLKTVQYKNNQELIEILNTYIS